MKTSAIKVVLSLFNLKNVNKLKSNINKKTIFGVVLGILLLALLYYFLKPFFFDLNSNKQLFENKIDKVFKLNSSINGKISYNLFPTPRIHFKNTDLKFNNSDSSKLKVENLILKISILNLGSLQRIKLENLIISEQEIEIYSKGFKDYFNYLAISKNKNILIKNSTLFFLDDQGGKVTFEKVSLDQKYKNDIHQININGFFAKNKIKISYFDEKNKKKYFKIKIPKLNISSNVIFDPKSNLKSQKGQLKLNFLENILLVNFSGSKDFKITDSFFRGKFLNSKINGDINFKKKLFF